MPDMLEVQQTRQINMIRALSAPNPAPNSNDHVDSEVGEKEESGYRTPGGNLFTRRAISSTMAEQLTRPRGPERIHSHLDPFYEDQGLHYNSESLARIVSAARQGTTPRGRIGIRDRICCFQWTWFTMVRRI